MLKLCLRNTSPSSSRGFPSRCPSLSPSHACFPGCHRGCICSNTDLSAKESQNICVFYLKQINTSGRAGGLYTLHSTFSSSQFTNHPMVNLVFDISSGTPHWCCPLSIDWWAVFSDTQFSCMLLPLFLHITQICGLIFVVSYYFYGIHCWRVRRQVSSHGVAVYGCLDIV